MVGFLFQQGGQRTSRCVSAYTSSWHFLTFWCSQLKLYKNNLWGPQLWPTLYIVGYNNGKVSVLNCFDCDPVNPCLTAFSHDSRQPTFRVAKSVVVHYETTVVVETSHLTWQPNQRWKKTEDHAKWMGKLKWFILFVVCCHSESVMRFRNVVLVLIIAVALVATTFLKFVDQQQQGQFSHLTFCFISVFDRTEFQCKNKLF